MNDNKHTGRGFAGKGYYIALILCAAAIGGKPYRGELRWIGQAEKLLKRKTLYRVILNDQDSHPVPPLGT